MNRSHRIICLTRIKKTTIIVLTTEWQPQVYSTKTGMQNMIKTIIIIYMKTNINDRKFRSIVFVNRCLFKLHQKLELITSYNIYIYIYDTFVEQFFYRISGQLATKYARNEIIKLERPQKVFEHTRFVEVHKRTWRFQLFAVDGITKRIRVQGQDKKKNHPSEKSHGRERERERNEKLRMPTRTISLFCRPT